MLALRFFKIIIILSYVAVSAQKSSVKYFSMQDVRLGESIFKAAMERDNAYLSELDADRLMAPYRKEAGLAVKAKNYPNWESTGLDGHIGGHYLSALSLMYASKGDEQLLRKVHYIVDELEACQNANGNGYVGGVPNGKTIWKEIAEGNIRAHSFGLNDRWVPLYNIHKTYAGLRDAYLYTGNEKAKQILIKFTDWMALEVSILNEQQIQDMLRSEHGGLNEIFADVYSFTGDKKYLELAKKFSHHELLDALMAHQDKLTGIHANMQIPKVIGFKRIAELDNEPQWEDAAAYFWQNVTGKRSVAIGGNSVSEHFNQVDDFSGMIKSVEGPETCNTYNMLKLTKQLYGTDPKASYIDYYENALYNHILTTQHSEKGGFVYFTPMRPGHYRVYSQPDTSFWCCVGSGMENHAKYGEMIYAHNGNSLYVNLFIPSTLNWKEKGITIIQQNNFPETPETTITVNPKKSTSFTLKLRCPGWTDKKGVKIWINGKEQPAPVDTSGYFTITRKWKRGDVVRLRVAMYLNKEQLPDGSDYYAFRYGPLVLAAPFGSEGQTGLFADESRGGHIAHGPQIPLNTMPVVLGNSADLLNHLKPEGNNPLTFQLGGLYPEKYASGFTIVPFYKIQAERYIIYWPQADARKVAAMQAKQAETEKCEQLLNAITTDKVSLGQQQPENDHLIQMQDAYTGYMEDHHYRDARGWFSYQLATGKKARYLYIAYYDANPNRALNVEVNGQNMTTRTFEGKFGNAMQFILLQLPDDLVTEEKLTIKFSTHPNTLTPKITEVRLLTQQWRP
jgi:uncharacterized protein